MLILMQWSCFATYLVSAGDRVCHRRIQGNPLCSHLVTAACPVSARENPVSRASDTMVTTACLHMPKSKGTEVGLHKAPLTINRWHFQAKKSNAGGFTARGHIMRTRALIGRQRLDEQRSDYRLAGHGWNGCKGVKGHASFICFIIHCPSWPESWRWCMGCQGVVTIDWAVTLPRQDLWAIYPSCAAITTPYQRFAPCMPFIWTVLTFLFFFMSSIILKLGCGCHKPVISCLSVQWDLALWSRGHSVKKYEQPEDAVSCLAAS